MAGCLVLAVPFAARAQAGPTGSVLGRVADGDGVPVEGAVVRLRDADVETDEDGMFGFSEVPAGRHTVTVTRLGYGTRSVELVIRAQQTSRVLLTLTEAAITLAPLTVEALSVDSLRARGAGYRRGIVTRAQLARWEGTTMRLPDVLRSEIPSIRVRREESRVGSDVCIELRASRTVGSQCLSPAVYLDGVPITNPTFLFSTLEIAVVERIEVVPAAEAGARFGTGALFGALLIETRRPGGARGAGAPHTRTNFDWSTDPTGHRTAYVIAASTVGNAAGLALGLAVADQCLRVRKPANDTILSDCALLPTLVTGAAAVALPAMGTGFAARVAGQTPESRGLLAPATVGSAMVALPGYAVILSGMRNDSDLLQWIGRGLVGVGAPLAATLADYLFRQSRD